MESCITRHRRRASPSGALIRCIMSIADLRREYSLTGMRRRDLEADPIVQFRKWFDQAAGTRASGRVRKFFIRLYKRLLLASGAELLDLTAMTLATVDKQGQPSARVVLLKGVDQRGFIFYTNYDSRKGQELAENPQAALVLYWPDQERQVRIAGKVSKLPPAESDGYFRSPAAREPGGRVGFQTKRAGKGPRGAGGAVEANRDAIRRAGSASPPVLGRIPAVSRAGGILAGAAESSSRSVLLHPPAWPALAGSAALALSPRVFPKFRLDFLYQRRKVRVVKRSFAVKEAKTAKRSFSPPQS